MHICFFSSASKSPLDQNRGLMLKQRIVLQRNKNNVIAEVPGAWSCKHIDSFSYIFSMKCTWVVALLLCSCKTCLPTWNYFRIELKGINSLPLWGRLIKPPVQMGKVILFYFSCLLLKNFSHFWAVACLVDIIMPYKLDNGPATRP